MLRCRSEDAYIGNSRVFMPKAPKRAAIYAREH